MNSQYSETIRIDPLKLVLFSAAASTVATALFGFLIVHVHGSVMAHGQVLAQCFFTLWAILFVLAWSGKAVKLSVEDAIQWSGKQAPTLIIRGNTKGSTSYIPLHTLVDIQQVEFSGPLGKLNIISGEAGQKESVSPDGHLDKTGWWRTFFHLRQADDLIRIGRREVPGYRGPGLLVTYRARTFTGGNEQYIWGDQFPTRDPATLIRILQHNSHSGITRE